MGRHQSSNSSPPNLYPQDLQLKLYQAFIFSIPILFSIILFLLFYLFYLKRRASSLSHQHPVQQLPSSQSASFLPSQPWHLGIKGDLKDKLNVVPFDEELRAKDTVCCVCLGEFEMQEELRQVPSCRHVFHSDCIRHWLRTNATCPLCRCPVLLPTPTKMGLPAVGHSSEPGPIQIENDSPSPGPPHEQHVIEVGPSARSATGGSSPSSSSNQVPSSLEIEIRAASSSSTST